MPSHHGRRYEKCGGRKQLTIFNPFEHIEELVTSNVDGGVLLGMPWHSTTLLPGGEQAVNSAVPNHPETLQFYMHEGADHWYPVTQDQAYVQQLWLHAVYGADAPTVDMLAAPMLTEQGLGGNFQIDYDRMYNAVVSMPHVVATIVGVGITADQVMAYAHAETPWAFV